MNIRILFKSFRLAFRAKKRVTAFIIIYAVLYIVVGRGLQQGGPPGFELPLLGMALIVATVYAILIAQFRRRDIAILKCVSWANDEILLLLVGEVIIVALTSFLLVFQVSVEVLGLISYVGQIELLGNIRDLIVVGFSPMILTLFYIVILQIPGLALAQARAMRIPPMRALREE
ncbi:MAG: hypothetical protein HXY34_11720 [Candidatus Thorarchaeota archaeon]|nr:hypothetical protein [Candidatus Thorarchaeota archaeon]